MERESAFLEYSGKIDDLLADARMHPEVQALLHYGTPEQKLAKLEEHGLTFDVLVRIHRELETIVYQGSLRFWWW